MNTPWPVPAKSVGSPVPRRPKSMPILLRNARTGFFYAGYNVWRVYPEQAFDFQSLERAHEWITTTQLQDVEVIQLPNGVKAGLDPAPPGESSFDQERPSAEGPTP